MSYVLLGFAVLAGVILLSRWFLSAEPAHMAWALRWLGLCLSGLFTAFFFVTGRLAIAVPMLVVSLLLLMRALGLSGPPRVKARKRGKQSTVQTEYLDMLLDVESGRMAGRVRKGAFQGRDLSALRPEELLALWRECAAKDDQSRRVLESYLDRHHEGWREAAQAQANAARGASQMTPDEARELLGVGPDANEREIKDAHRKLMRTHHPDQGGSPELAARLNEARDVLLGS